MARRRPRRRRTRRGRPRARGARRGARRVGRGPAARPGGRPARVRARAGARARRGRHAPGPRGRTPRAGLTRRAPAAAAGRCAGRWRYAAPVERSWARSRIARPASIATRRGACHQWR
ncbi:hypothetical protein E5226_15335 [Cellulomonas shaoxiangyii]|nr:hypothetical protein E5226_15335 [Cellulomonas shaoxiangyii]